MNGWRGGGAPRMLCPGKRSTRLAQRGLPHAASRRGRRPLCMQPAHAHALHAPTHGRPTGTNCVPQPAGGAVKKQAELFFPAEFADDFPVSLQISEKFGLVYVVTKLGLLFVYDLETTQVGWAGCPRGRAGHTLCMPGACGFGDSRQYGDGGAMRPRAPSTRWTHTRLSA